MWSGSSVALLFVLACALHAQRTNPADLLKVDVPPADQRLAYGQDQLQFGELRLPKGNGPHPLAIVLHGGCWTTKIGNLPEVMVTLALVRPLTMALAEEGIATWNVEYRRLGNSGGGWPGTFQDVAQAADYVKEIAPKYRLDLNRVIAMGHSAGGHLAFWLAARHKLPKASVLYSASPIRLAGTLNLDGSPDLAAARGIEQKVCGAPVITQLMGGSPDEVPDRYAQGSATGFLPIGVRQAHVAGGPFATFAKSFDALAKKSGDPTSVFVKEDAGHFDWLDPKSPVWKQVIGDVKSLLSK